MISLGVIAQCGRIDGTLQIAEQSIERNKTTSPLSINKNIKF